MLAQTAAEKQGREKTSGGQKTAFARGPESLPKYLQRFSLRGVHYGNSGPLSIGQKDNVSNDTQRRGGPREEHPRLQPKGLHGFDLFHHPASA